MQKVSDIANNPEPTAETRTWLKSILRFSAWWFAFFALLGPLSVCPICGQAGCPGGAASAAFSGGILAALISVPRWIRNSFRRRRSQKESS